MTRLPDAPLPAWGALLPARRATQPGAPAGAPRLLDALPLGAGLSLAVVGDDAGGRYPVPLLTSGGVSRRAVAGDGAAEALLRLLAAGAPGRTRAVGRFRLTSWYAGPAAGERPIPVDQTNESVVVGSAVVKWVAVAEEGPHPAPSLLGELTNSGFAGMPRPWGSVEWLPEDGGAARLLALVVEHLAGAVDGWTWAVDAVRRAAERGRPDEAVPAGSVVGRLVADLHRALAGTAGAAGPEEAVGWRSGALADLDRALAVSRGRAAEVLRTHEDAARRVLGRVPVDGGPVLRVHGDLHVGQVLRADGDDAPTYLLTDFDGNPVLPPAERVRRQPAAVDLAGALQSLTHVGLVVRRHAPALDPVAVDEAAAGARRACLRSYRDGLGPDRGLLDERLLQPFAVRQVCREFTYAARHLPRWSYVPEAALPRVLSGTLDG